MCLRSLLLVGISKLQDEEETLLQKINSLPGRTRKASLFLKNNYNKVLAKISTTQEHKDWRVGRKDRYLDEETHRERHEKTLALNGVNRHNQWERGSVLSRADNLNKPRSKSARDIQE